MKAHKNVIIIVIFIALSLMTTMLMAKTGKVNNIDFPFHWVRLMAVRHGEFGTVDGRATMTFYPWLTLVPFALLTFVIKNGVTMFYVIATAVVFATYAVGYYSFKDYDDDTVRAMLFSFIYTNSFAFLTNLLSTGAVPSSMCLAVMPVVFFGTLKHHWKLVAGALFFIAFTHLISILLALAMFAILVLVNHARMSASDWKHVSTIVVALFIVTGVYWVPMIHTLTEYRIMTPGYSMFWSNGFGQLLVSNTGLTLGLLTAIGDWKRMSKSDRALALLMLPVLALNLAFVPKLIPLLKAFQFAQRFDYFVALFGAYLTAKYFRADEKVAVTMMVALALVGVGSDVAFSTALDTTSVSTSVREDSGHALDAKSFASIKADDTNHDYELEK